MTVGADYQTGPLFDTRETIAQQIEAVLDGVTVYREWAAPSGPSVVLDGGGWSQNVAGYGFDYTLRVNCCLGNQSGRANAEVEELARQVFDALRQNNWSVEPVPPPGTLKFGDRDVPSVQMKIHIQHTPTG